MKNEIENEKMKNIQHERERERERERKKKKVLKINSNYTVIELRNFYGALYDRLKWITNSDQINTVTQ